MIGAQCHLPRPQHAHILLDLNYIKRPKYFTFYISLNMNCVTGPTTLHFNESDQHFSIIHYNLYSQNISYFTESELHFKAKISYILHQCAACTHLVTVEKLAMHRCCTFVLHCSLHFGQKCIYLLSSPLGRMQLYAFVLGIIHRPMCANISCLRFFSQRTKLVLQ